MGRLSCQFVSALGGYFLGCAVQPSRSYALLTQWFAKSANLQVGDFCPYAGRCGIWYLNTEQTDCNLVGTETHSELNLLNETGVNFLTFSSRFLRLPTTILTRHKGADSRIEF